MSNPVRRLSITHPRLPRPVEIPLSWDTFPEPLQRELDLLDANDDGTITYTAARGGSSESSFEVRHADGTADRLSRLLWSYGQSYPSNRRRADNATLADRTRAVRDIQNRIYDDVALSILGNGGNDTDQNDPVRWVEAKRVLEESADFIHLHRVAQVAMARYEETHNLEFYRIAEGFLLASRRFASMTRSGRADTLPLVAQALRTINPILDRADQAAFQREIQSPYLMAGMGSPITANLSTLQAENGVVYFGVAVPASFVTSHQADLNTTIARYFNETSPVTVRASTFQDRAGTQDFRLTATRVERDAPGPADDRIDLQSSFHINQSRLNRTVFQGRDMVYFRVGFHLPEATEALGDRHIRKFDITLSHGEDIRRIEGGFVLQNMTGQDSRDVFAGDLHVNERDYEVVRIMTGSLRSLGDDDQADQVERFYESINEQVTATVENWNQAYRRGEIDRVFLAGDLVDFVNIAGTLEHQGYRSTNVRRLKEILGRLEAPLYVVSGNHDHHGAAFPLSLHLRNFTNAAVLRGLYADHYDRYRFTSILGSLYLQGIRALVPNTSSDGGWVGDAIRELYADNPFSTPNDAFLDHHLREIGIYETYGVDLGNGSRVFAGPTETEHFNYNRYLLEEAHEPVGRDVIEALGIYVNDQHPNGKGFSPDTFFAFLRDIEMARANGQRGILAGHYPVFNAGDGPDQTPDSVDTLRGDAAWAVRLASWYYQNDVGEAVLSASPGAHVHHYGESDFRLDFADAEEEATFRRELGAILSGSDASTIFDDLHTLRHWWDLDRRIGIRRVQEPGSDGFPGPIMQSCNRDSCSYAHSHGTAFVNLPSAGIPSEDQSGYIILTTHPDGRIEVEERLIRVGPHANIVEVSGREMESFRRERSDGAWLWDTTRRGMPHFSPRTNPTAVVRWDPETPRTSPPQWDPFPLVYQYPLRKIGLTLDLGMGWDARRGDTGILAGGQILLPLSNHAGPLFGGPNYLAFGAEYSGLTNDLNTRAGVDFGLVTPYVTLNSVTSGNPILGGEAVFHSLLPIIPQVGIWGGSTLDGDWGAGVNFRFVVPALTYRYSGAYHRHH